MKPSKFLPLFSLLIFSLFISGSCWCAQEQSEKSKTLHKLLQSLTDPKLPALADTYGPAPGAILQVKGNGFQFQAVSGSANLEKNIPVKINDRFEIGSNTKMFTAVMVLQLAEQGVLSLDDKLSRWLPHWAKQIPYGDQVTLRQLANHTSGIKDYADEVIGGGISDDSLMRKQYSPAELVQHAIDSGKPDFTPGQSGHWKYCNTGYILLGMVLEKASHETYADLLHKMILAPLNMQSTSFLNAIPEAGTLVQGYVSFPRGKNTTEWNLSQGWAAGGIISNLTDMRIFLLALANGKLFSNADTLAKMASFEEGPYVAEHMVSAKGYGLGLIEYKNDVWGHGGQTIGYESTMMFVPGTDITMIALTNAAQGPVLEMTSLAGFLQQLAAENAPSKPITATVSDNFYRWVNQQWINSHSIAEDKSEVSGFTEIDDILLAKFKSMMAQFLAKKQRTEAEQKIVDFYQSYADMDSRNKLGIKPIAADLNAIAAIKTGQDLAHMIAKMPKFDLLMGNTTPFNFSVSVNDEDSSSYMILGQQSGLSLARKYYVENDKAAQIQRKNFHEYIVELLQLAGMPNPEKSAENAMKVETALAKISWTPAQSYDIKKTHNPTGFTELNSLLSNFDIPYYFKVKSYPTDIKININQPDYFKALNSLATTLPLAAWKDYLTVQLLTQSAAGLSDKFVNAKQAYKAKQGLEEKIEPIETRAVRMTSYYMGFLFGKAYIENVFDEKIRADVEQILNNIIAQYRQAITASTRLDADTKKTALKKIDNMLFNIAYPDVWRDYSQLETHADKLIENEKAIHALSHSWDMADLKRGTVDKDQWSMAPQMVNAYYDPNFNKFNLLAAILNPPFYDINASSAANYAGIGHIIAHEIGHAFDSYGASFDENGNLRNWWSKADLDKFNQLKNALIKQANAYEILPGVYADGALEIGEIMADLSGAEIALAAYLKSMQGSKIAKKQSIKEFFLALATSSRSKQRKKLIVNYNNSDPHPLDEYRVNGTVRNMDAFYEVFAITPADAMYLPTEKRVHLWAN